MLKVFSRTRIFLLTLYIFPVLLLLWFLANFSVNIPYWDQWRLTPIFERVAEGNATFFDFFTVHGHHRILIPKLIITALAFATKWNTQAEIICSVIFVIITFFAICKIAEIQFQNKNKNILHIANILVSLLLFSLVQHQNWLWGFTLFWFLTNLCLIIAIYFIYAFDHFSAKTKIFLAAISCFIGSFTLIQGLFSWFVLIPSIFGLEGKPKQKISRVTIWILLFILSCLIYSINYNPIREPKPFLFTEQPFLIINYFLAILGLPLVRISIPAILTGLILLSSFIFFTFYFLKKPWFNKVSRGEWRFARTKIRSDFCNGDLSSDPKIFRLKRWGFIPNYFDKFIFAPAAIPWLTIGTFSLISALSISVGRAEYGVDNAMISSRYTTTSILLIISLIYLFGLFLQQQQKYLSIYKIFAVVMTGIMMVNSVYVVASVKSSFPYMESRKECLEIINYLEDSEFIQESQDSCLVLMNGKTWLVREGAEIMAKLGWREIPQNLEFITETKQTYGYLDYPQTTENTLIINKDETISLGGWAIRPDRNKQPNLVLLSSGENQYFFANAIVNLESNDIAKVLKSKLYSRARWKVKFSAKSLPVGETVIKAWVYNSDKQEFIKLNDEVKVRVEDG
ncbi:MAG: YfhO family protein [Okeania sp. SIO3B3]|nr:YfhO family protein [Okeania sp. SIO3B3]